MTEKKITLRIHSSLTHAVLAMHEGSEAEVNSKMHEIALSHLDEYYGQSPLLEAHYARKKLQAARGNKERLAHWLNEHTPLVATFLSPLALK